MRETIIETEAMSRFDNAVDDVVGAGRGLSGFVLAYGQAGCPSAEPSVRNQCAFLSEMAALDV